jgi:aerobic-type carbon monoxide dehydrogenase small subunit (CoxS/CutS family)
MPQSRFEFKVNGVARTVTTDPRRTLLEVLREDLGLTGTKYGCGEGQCRACTVLVDGRPELACLMPIARAASREILTIEGLAASGRLDPVQQAFLEEGAFQCGYCTPGMVLATVSLLKSNPKPTDAEIIAALNGHLCRCCGYPKILAAVRRAAASSPGR